MQEGSQEVTRSCWTWGGGGGGGHRGPSLRAGLEGGLGKGSPRKVTGVPQPPGPKPLSFLQETVLPGSATGALSAFLLLFSLDPGDQTP